MKEFERVGPRYLSETPFDAESFEREYPNAREALEGGLFISHAGADRARIQRDLVNPVIHQRFAPSRYFLHSRGSGAAARYMQVVRAALEYCDKFLVVVSHHSVGHEWVAAEVDWAVTKGSPVVVCLLDDSNPAAVNRALAASAHRAPNDNVGIVDFRDHVESAQQRLAALLDRLLRKLPS